MRPEDKPGGDNTFSNTHRRVCIYSVERCESKHEFYYFGDFKSHNAYTAGVLKRTEGRETGKMKKNVGEYQCNSA